MTALGHDQQVGELLDNDRDLSVGADSEAPGLPVTSMVTGKVAIPELWLPTIPTDATVPNIWLVDPLGMMTACWPDFSCPTSVSSTLALTA